MSIFKDWSVKAKLHQSYWSHMSYHYWYWGFNWDFKVFSFDSATLVYSFPNKEKQLHPFFGKLSSGFICLLNCSLHPVSLPLPRLRTTSAPSLVHTTTISTCVWAHSAPCMCSAHTAPCMCTHWSLYVCTLVFVCVHTAPNDDVLQTAVLLHSTCPCPRLGPQHVHT